MFYVHLRVHIELNSHAVYSIFIGVKNILMESFRRKWSACFMTSTLFLLNFVVAKIILKNWTNVTDYGMCVFSNFLRVVLLLLSCVRYTGSHAMPHKHWNIDSLSVFSIHIMHKMFWHFCYIVWLYRKHINYRNHFRPYLYC